MGRLARIAGTLAALLVAPAAVAQEQAAATVHGGNLAGWLFEAIVFGAVGIAVLIGAYYLWELITPYSVKDQLIKEKNVAVGIVVAAFILGTALIIAAAITPS
jgi:hypothetical protein